MEYKVTRTIFARLMFACLAAHLVPVSGQKIHAVEDNVFCPLQKIWVKKNFTASPKPFKPLNEICAPEKLRDSFLYESSKNSFSLKVFSSPNDAEKLFFAYAAKGKRAFAEIAAPSSDLPEHQLAKLVAPEKSAGGDFKKDFQPIIAAAFSLAQAARPPTFQVLINPHFEFAQNLEKISRRINPRSPPALV